VVYSLQDRSFHFAINDYYPKLVLPTVPTKLSTKSYDLVLLRVVRIDDQNQDFLSIRLLFKRDKRKVPHPNPVPGGI